MCGRFVLLKVFMLFIYDPIHYLFSDELRTCVFGTTRHQYFTSSI